MGYTPVSGRLHTRYSPVRRSPSRYCYLMMPLDLHVLSLSLAFILSQDQTLRCCLSCLFFFFSKKGTKLFCLFCSFTRSSLKTVWSAGPVLRLTYSFAEIDQGHRYFVCWTIDSCTTSCLLQFFQCSRFCPWGISQKRCKVTAVFYSSQIFSHLFFAPLRHFSHPEPPSPLSVNHLQICCTTYF